MLDVYFDDTNIANPLDETQMNALIETFVAVHGEEKRAQITERLISTTFLFLPRSFDTLIEVKESLYDKRRELADKFFEELGYDKLSTIFSIEDIFYTKESYETGNFNSTVVTKLDKICEIMKLDYELDVYRQISRKYNQSDECLDCDYIASDNIKNQLKAFFDKIQKLDAKKGYGKKEEELLEQYEFISNSYRKLEDREKKIKQEKNLKLDEVLSEKVAGLLGRDKGNFESSYDSRQRYDLITAYESMLTRGRKNFADEMTLSSWMKSAYFSFFKEMGIYCGADLDAYAKNEKLMSLLYDESVITELTNIEANYENKRARENPFFKDAVQQIRSLDIKGGNMYIVSELQKFLLHNERVNAEVLHYITNDDKLGTICILPLSTHLTRETFLHECEHIVESSLSVNDGQYFIKSGFETNSFEPDDEDYDGHNLSAVDTERIEKRKKIREMEILNETFTQLFAYLLCEKAVNKGLVVGQDKHKNSWHLKMVKLFNDFYEFSDRLSDVRFKNDRQGFEKAFGKVNCLVMNEIAKEYYELLKGDLYYSNFASSVKEYTGFDVQDVDFLNLPEGLVWSEPCKKFLEKHIWLEKVVQNLKVEGNLTNKNDRQSSEEFSGE